MEAKFNYDTPSDTNDGPTYESELAKIRMMKSNDQVVEEAKQSAIEAKNDEHNTEVEKELNTPGDSMVKPVEMIPPVDTQAVDEDAQAPAPTDQSTASSDDLEYIGKQFPVLDGRLEEIDKAAAKAKRQNIINSMRGE